MAETRDTEIAQVEVELQRLRAQYANIKRSARYLVPFCVVMGAFIVAFFVYSVQIESTGGAITAVAILAALIGLAIASRHEKFLIFISSPGGGGPYPYASHAEFLQSAIAKREKLLSEVKKKGS